MEILFTEKEFNETKIREKLPIKCSYCNTETFKTKRELHCKFRNNKGFGSGKGYCSKECYNKDRIKAIQVKCGNCHKQMTRLPRQIEKTKYGLLFCSSSCSATYSNKLEPRRKPEFTKCKICKVAIKKNSGSRFCPSCKIIRKSKQDKNIRKITCLHCKETKIIRSYVDYKRRFCSKKCRMTYDNINKKFHFQRSKLEKYIEKHLNENYTDLEIIFNDRKTLGLELDIYIPSLNIAFEINGIVHYEPIFGETKLKNTQRKDNLKKIKCKDLSIDLFVIDIRELKNPNDKNNLPYLKFIIDKLESRMVGVGGIEPI